MLKRLSMLFLIGLHSVCACAHSVEGTYLAPRQGGSLLKPLIENLEQPLQPGFVSVRVVRHAETIDIEWLSHIQSVVGFGHLPNTAAEHQRWSMGVSLMMNPKALWVFNPKAKCQPIETVLSSPLLMNNVVTQRVPSKMHPGPFSLTSHWSDNASFQKAVLGRHTFQCESMIALAWLDVMLFAQFPLLNQAVSSIEWGMRPEAARYQPLSASSNRLDF